MLSCAIESLWRTQISVDLSFKAIFIQIRGYICHVLKSSLSNQLFAAKTIKMFSFGVINHILNITLSFKSSVLAKLELTNVLSFLHRAQPTSPDLLSAPARTKSNNSLEWGENQTMDHPCCRRIDLIENWPLTDIQTNVLCNTEIHTDP